MKTEELTSVKIKLTATVLMIVGLIYVLADLNFVIAQNEGKSPLVKNESVQPKFALLVGLTKYKKRRFI